MGFFGNLLDSVKSAGQWALDHSADIGPVIGAVAKAAGVLAAEDEHVPRYIDAIIQASNAAEDASNLDHYPTNFRYANDQLVTLADNSAKQEQSAFLKARAKAGGPVRGSTTTSHDHVSGIWRMPIGLDVNGHASTSMYGDLSKFLGTMNIPSTYTSGNSTFDLVDQLGSALFANNGPQAKNNDPSTDSDNIINTTGFSIDLGNNTSVHCAHSYYTVPLGKSATDDALHSAISVRHVTTEPHQTNFLADRKKVSFHKPLATGANQWLITLNVTWGSAPAAEGAQKSFLAYFASGNVGMSLQTNHLSGILQLVKVTAPPDTTPSAVKLAVQAAAVHALTTLTSAQSKLTTASGEKSQTQGGGFPPVSVDVRVTDSSFIVAGSS